MERPEPPRSLAICGEGLPRIQWRRWIAGLAAAGVDAVLLRDRGLPDRELLERLTMVSRAAAGPPVLAHRRADLALAAGTAGLHLPADSVPVAAARELLGPAVWIGRSAHGPEQLAAAAGVDYVVLGPVFATPEKLRFGPPLGIERFARWCRESPVPVLAIGGIDETTLPEVLNAGAAGFAAIRLFQRPPGVLRRIVESARSRAS